MSVKQNHLSLKFTIIGTERLQLKFDGVHLHILLHSKAAGFD